MIADFDMVEKKHFCGRSLQSTRSAKSGPWQRSAPRSTLRKMSMREAKYVGTEGKQRAADRRESAVTRHLER
jgi:hypothetical protein